MVELNDSTELPDASVVIGGPSCQPFSVGGNQQGRSDKRDGFPIFLTAVDRLRPEAFIMDNVRGIACRNREYLVHITNQFASLGYIIKRELLNSVYYEVPQQCERLLIVGHKGHFSFPSPPNYLFTCAAALGVMAVTAPL
jgi:DNA (cytosine-5)-methyltransferase 1